MTDPEGKSTNSRKTLLVLVVIGTLVALGAAAWFLFLKPSPWAATSMPYAGAQAKALTGWDRGIGNPKAPALIIEYASPQCKHCARFDMNYFPLFKKKYIETGKVYYVLRVFPLSAADIAVEAIARCLPADKYFSFLDLIWQNQATWDPVFKVPDVHAGLVEMGQKAGLTAKEVDACIANQQVATKISAVGTEGTDKYGVKSVPKFIIDGQARAFPDDWDAFQNDVDAAVKKGK